MEGILRKPAKLNHFDHFAELSNMMILSSFRRFHPIRCSDSFHNSPDSPLFWCLIHPAFGAYMAIKVVWLLTLFPLILMVMPIIPHKTFLYENTYL